MKFIKLLIYYFVFIICLIFSKTELGPAKELWFFLFNNYDENNLFLFVSINMFYLGWLVFYISSKRFIFNILKIIFKILKSLKLDKLLYEFILYLYYIYHHIFKLYRKITIHILFYFLTNLKIYNSSSRHAIRCFIQSFDFDIKYYFPEKFENKGEALFYFRLLKQNYTIPVLVEINNKKYLFTIGEILTFLTSNEEYLRTFSTIQYSKALKHLLVFSKFTSKYFDCYLDIGQFNWTYYRKQMYRTSNIQLIPAFLKYHAIYDNYKQAKLFLTLFKCDKKLIRDFFNLNLFRLFKKLNKKKLFLKINTLNSPLIYRRDSYNSYEYSLFYLNLLIYNYRFIFRKLLCFNIINEIKTVYSIITYSLMYKILSFFILSIFLKVIILFILIYNIIKNWIYLRNYNKLHLYYYLYKLFNHKVIRIMFYNVAYLFNLFIFDFNFFYFYLLNYLFITVFFIIWMTIYDFYKYFKANKQTSFNLLSLGRILLEYYYSIDLDYNWILRKLSKVAIILKKISFKNNKEK